MRTGPDSPLVDLLGATRARMVDLLRAQPASVAEVAGQLGLSEQGVRRHLGVLERDGLVAADTTVRRDGPGRPSLRYALTAKARRLYPDRSADVANELLDYLEQHHGRRALIDYLRWRQDRQAERYAAALEGVDDPEGRAARLAELLTADGFLADTTAEPAPGAAPGAIALRQGHCAIADVAAAHPELCAHEAALFQRLLGGRVSRRTTIAGGAARCVALLTAAPPRTPRIPQTTGTPSTGAPDVHQG